MFTDKQIKSLLPHAKPYRVFESGVDKGFGLQVLTRSRVFFMQYHSPVTQKRRFMKLGKYPDTSLKLARNHCRLARQQIDNGLDPQIERNKECKKQEAALEAERVQEEIRQATGTVTQLFEFYIEYLKNEGKRAHHDVAQLFAKDIKPAIGHFIARDVKTTQIRDIIREVYQRGAKIRANHTRTFLMAAYSFGIRLDNDAIYANNTHFRIDYNPVRDIPVPSKSKPGERNLSAKEIRLLWSSLDTSNMTDATKTVIRLLFATGGQRVEEVLHMRWDEFDFDRRLWELSSSRTKNGKPHVVPLSELAISLIENLGTCVKDSDYVFPHKDDKSKPMPYHTISKAVHRFCHPPKDKNGKLKYTAFPKFILRDIRRTVKSRMGEIGISKEIRDRLQNHALHDVSSKHYDRYDYLPPKKDAIDTWNKWLTNTIFDVQPESNIIDISTHLKSVISS